MIDHIYIYMIICMYMCIIVYNGVYIYIYTHTIHKIFDISYMAEVMFDHHVLLVVYELFIP